MAEPLLNVNQEINNMKTEIEAIRRYNFKVTEIANSVKLYKTNMVANISTIVTTIFMIICAFVQSSQILLGVAIVIGIAVLVAFAKMGAGDNKAGITLASLIILTLLLSVICFMVAYTYEFAMFLPLISCLAMWIATIISNFKMKNLAWDIASNL